MHSIVDEKSSMSDQLVKQEIVWVETNEHLDEVCELWQQNTNMLAVDTEFMRSRTYYPIAGLIQVSDGQKNYLIDPTKINDYYPLTELFEDENILFVLHSCSEDLEVFQHTFNCLPKKLIDTQVAAAIAGYAFSLGYANLVREMLDIELPKGETRSDWLQRPLSQSQMLYAAIDVEYLYVVAQKLIQKLTELERLEWALDDGASLVANFFVNQNPDRFYLRIKSAWKLKSRQLLALQGLSRWREDLAQERDVPRNRILKENALFSIALKSPTEISKLKDFEGMSERMIRHNGEKILEIIHSAKKASDAELPAVMPPPLRSAERNILDELRKTTQAVANSLGVPTEVLVKKKDYEMMLFEKRRNVLEIPETLRGWRLEIIGKPLLERLSQLGDGEPSELAE